MVIRKKKFKARFLKRVFTRFHMSLILLCTVFSGLILSKLLLIFGLDNMLIRYPIVLVGAYFSFFLFMKLWLLYLTSPYRKKRRDDVFDSIDVVQLPDNASYAEVYSVSVEGGGGQFGGAGVSGSFEHGEKMTVLPESLDSVSVTAEAGSDVVTETVGEAASGIAEEGGILLIPLALLLLASIGGGVYLIYEAPLILSEAAFEIVLATSLIKSSKKMDNPDWIGSILRTTWKPFLFTLFVSVVGALFVKSLCPQAIKLTEIIKECI